MTLRAYQPVMDEPACFALWHRALGDEWRIDEEVFHQLISLPGNEDRCAHFVVEMDQQAVGFICAQQGAGDEAGVLCVLVAPEFQRRGIGRQLVEHCLTTLASRCVNHVRVGWGGSAYFCPGVPVQLPMAKSFYESLGWRFDEVLYDMSMNLNEFDFDPAWLRRPASHGFGIDVVQNSQIPSLLAFESLHFPEWLDSFEGQLKAGKLDNILVATDHAGDVVGSLTIFTDRDGFDCGIRWRALLGAPIGGFGVLGVREDVRDKGIGLGLAAEATRLLVERGVQVSFVGWTYLESLYGRLGYRVWRRYHMSDTISL